MKKRTKRIIDQLDTLLAMHKTDLTDARERIVELQGRVQILAEIARKADHAVEERQKFCEIMDKERVVLDLRMDQVCARNAFYSDLIHALTGNRDHETASVIEFQAKQVVDAVGQLSVETTESAVKAPGKDCQPFCKCYLSEKCVNGTTQCPAGECKRVEQLSDMHDDKAAICADCHRTIGAGFRECQGNCNLPF